MSDYKERANSLREHANLIEASGTEVYGPSATRLLMYDLRNAAAAIEALIGTVGDLQAIRERLEEENDALRLEPKRGEIVRCRECRWGHLCVMGQHLGLDGFCSKGKREVQE